MNKTGTDGIRLSKLATVRTVMAGLGALVAVAAFAQVAADDLARGAQLVQKDCSTCHGLNGQGASNEFPNLAGQNEKYLAKQLRDFASGARTSLVMSPKATALDELAIRGVTKYYQSQTPVAKPTSDPMLASVGAFVYERGNPYSGLPGCVSCHGTGARGHAELPRLAGQSPQYLERQLKQFASRARSNDGSIMAVIASRLTELEMKAVVEHLGAMK